MDTVDSEQWQAAYGGILKRAEKRTGEAALRGASSPRIVAQTIFRAATDSSWRLRYQAGWDAKTLLVARWLLPERLFSKLLEKVMLD